MKLRTGKRKKASEIGPFHPILARVAGKFGTSLCLLPCFQAKAEVTRVLRGNVNYRSGSILIRLKQTFGCEDDLTCAVR